MSHWRGTQHTGFNSFNTGVNMGTEGIKLYATFLGRTKKENRTNTRQQKPDLELNGSSVLY